MGRWRRRRWSACSPSGARSAPASLCTAPRSSGEGRARHRPGGCASTGRAGDDGAPDTASAQSEGSAGGHGARDSADQGPGPGTSRGPEDRWTAATQAAAPAAAPSEADLGKASTRRIPDTAAVGSTTMAAAWREGSIRASPRRRAPLRGRRSSGGGAARGAGADRASIPVSRTGVRAAGAPGTAASRSAIRVPGGGERILGIGRAGAGGEDRAPPARGTTDADALRAGRGSA